MEKSENSRGLLFVTAAVALGVLLSETLRESVGAVVVPFAAAYIAAKLTRPLGAALSRACRVKEKIGCTVWGVLVCFAAGYAVTAMSGRLWEQIMSVTTKLPAYAEEAAARITDISENITARLPFFDGDSRMGDIMGSVFREAASELGGAAAGVLGSAVSGFPGGILSVFIAVIAYLYLVADIDGAGRSIRKIMSCVLPDNAVRRVCSVWHGLEDSVFAYLRAYAVLMTVTFFELSVGFTLIGAQNPLAVALITALVDALPLFGCGIIIVPWALWCFLEGETGRAVGLLLIQAVVCLVRQLIEPRLIGKMTGVHPFVALVVLFVGLKTGGVTGMICAPILLMSLVRMREDRED